MYFCNLVLVFDDIYPKQGLIKEVSFQLLQQNKKYLSEMKEIIFLMRDRPLIIQIRFISLLICLNEFCIK